MKSGFLGNFQILIGKSGSVLQIEKTLTKSGRLACMSFHLHPTNVFQFYIFEIACIDDFMQIPWCIIMQTLHMAGLYTVYTICFVVEHARFKPWTCTIYQLIDSLYLHEQGWVKDGKWIGEINKQLDSANVWYFLHSKIIILNFQSIKMVM